MHEFSLVRALLRQVEDVRRVAGGGQIVGIRVSLGPLTGVEPMLVQTAFAQLAPDAIGSHVELNMELVPLSAECRECENDFELQDFQFLCPHCGSRQVRVTGGDEFQLISVQVMQLEPAAGAVE